MEKEETTAVGISSHGLTIRGKRTYELVAVLCLAILIVIAYAFFEHKADAKQEANDIVQAINKMTEAQQATVRAQLEMNCLIAMPQDKRVEQFTNTNSFCKQISNR